MKDIVITTNRTPEEIEEALQKSKEADKNLKTWPNPHDEVIDDEE